MPGPSTLLSCDAGTVHPRSFASAQLARLESFKQFWADAQQHAKRAGHSEGQDLDDFALGVINSVLWVKLCTIFSAILDAAAVAENWIVIDRTAAKSPAADLLIEAAMGQTASRPPILVIDALTRLQNFKGPTGNGALAEATKANMEKLEAIKAGGIVFGTDETPGQATISQFYNVEDFMDPNTFNDMELPRPAEPAHLRPDGTIPDRVKWQYHYLSTFFGGGSHYIVLENAHDSPDLTSLGSFGFVCANGQGIMFDRLKTRIQAGESLVMLHNTGGVVQAFASLRQAMLEQFPPYTESELLDKLELVSPQAWSLQFGLPEILMMKELHQRAPMLLRTSVVSVDVMVDTSEDVLSTLTCCFAGGGGVPELGLGEAEQLCIITAWKRHMTLMENASKYEIYANASQFVLYVLGVSTTLIAIFYGMPVPDEALANAGTLGADLGLDVASGDPSSGSGDDPAALPELDPNALTPLDLIMVLLPLLMTFIGTVRTKVRPREKWATCLMAAMQIVQQIYYYRLRTDRYDTQAAPPPSDGDEEAEPVSPKMREANARQMFVDTCTQVYSHAISTEVSKGGALQMGKMARLQTQHEAERNEFKLRLRLHVDKRLYHQRPKKEKKEKNPMDEMAAKKKKGLGFLKRLGKKNKIAAMVSDAVNDAVDAVQEAAEGVGDAAAAVGGQQNGGGKDEKLAPVKVVVGDDLGAKKGGGMDDLTSQMPIESYVDVRVRAIVDYLERRAPVVARRSLVIEMVSMLANTAGAVLGVLKLATWAPVSVAIASTAMAVMDYFYVPSQLAATNRALEECHNLLIYFDSLSLVQRKTRKVKLQCANTVENAVLNIISAQTGVSPALPSEQGGDDEEAEE